MRTWFAKPGTQKDGNGAGWLTAEKVLAAVAGGQLNRRRWTTPRGASCA